MNISLSVSDAGCRAQSSKNTHPWQNAACCAHRTLPQGYFNCSRVCYNFYMIPIISPTLITTGRQIPVSQALQQAVQKIVNALRPEKIILFGSFAYGKPTPDSDVDLLIILRTELAPKDRSWQVSKLLIPRPFPLDILVKTPEEIALAIQNRDNFIQEIVSKGIILYERAE